MNKRRILIIVVSCAVAGLASFFVASVWIVGAGLRDRFQRADVAVILGNEVTKDGKPSRRLRARLDRGIEIYRSGFAKYIVVSGGVGRSGVDEAVAMRRYLIENRVPAERIIEDHEGVNTWETAVNLARIMKERRLQGAIIVTQYFHIVRCRLALRKMGITPIWAAHANYYEVRDLYSIPREVVACGAYLLRRPQ